MVPLFTKVDVPVMVSGTVLPLAMLMAPVPVTVPRPVVRVWAVVTVVEMVNCASARGTAGRARRASRATKRPDTGRFVMEGETGGTAKEKAGPLIEGKSRLATFGRPR